MNKQLSKIGIITFHCAENYGAFLQTYALQEWLSQHTDILTEVNVIDYRPEFLIEPYEIHFRGRVSDNASLMSKCKAFMVFLFELPYKRIKKRKFKKAKRKLNLTRRYYNTSGFKLDDSYRALVLGSDQIWNPELTEGVNPVYYGVPAPDGCIKISYAASTGMSAYPDEIKSEVASLLKNIDYIGVREQDSIVMIKELCDKNVEVNVDPTLLLDPDTWRKQLKTIHLQNYILIYQLRPSPEIMNDAYELAKRTGKKILHFGDPSIRPRFSDVTVKSVSFSGPFEFISYIAAADLVLTDSFHAVCFSILFKKQFFAYLHKTRSERLRSLANIGGFRNRLIENGNRINDAQFDLMKDSSVKELIFKFDEIREESERFLIQALSNIGD